MLDLLRLEGRFMLQQRALPLLMLGFLIYGFIINLEEIGVGMDLMQLNAPYRLTFFLGLTSLLAVFAAMVFGAATYLREQEYGLTSMLGQLAVREKSVAQFAVATSAALLAVSLITAGLFLSSWWPGLQDRMDAVQPLHFIWPWMLFVLPNTLMCSVWVFALCRRFNRSTAVYVGAVPLFLLPWVALILAQAPIFGGTTPTITPSLQLALSMLDPSGLVAFFEQTRFWSPTEKSTLLIGLKGTFLWNRILWLLLSLTGFFLIWRKLSWSMTPQQQTAKPMPEFTAVHSTLSWVEPKKQFAWRAMIGLEIRTLLGHWAFRAFLLIWLVLIAVGVSMVLGNQSEFSGRYPTTALLLAQTLEGFPALALVGILVFAQTIIWRERTFHIDGLLGATPASNAHFLAGKLGALAFIPFSMLVLLILTCNTFQALTGYWRWDILQYSSTFYYFGLPVLFQALLVLLAHGVVMRSRFAHPLFGTMTATLLLACFHLFGTEEVHPLLRLNEFPPLLRIHSAFMGYGLWQSQFHALALYWGLAAVLVLVLTHMRWPRLDRLISFKTRILAVCAIASSCAFLGMHLAQKMPATWNQSARFDALADYERRFQSFAAITFPQYIDMDMHIDFYPATQSYAVRANCTIENDGTTRRNMLISSRQRLTHLHIDGAEIHVEEENDFINVYRAEFHRTLLPNTRRHMEYEVEQQSKPFDIDMGMVRNGSCINQRDFEPILGYLHQLEIKDPWEREARGLTTPVDQPETTTLVTRKRSFKATLSTSLDQQISTSGHITEQWESEERRYARFVAKAEIYPMISYVSGRYQVSQTNHEGIAIEVYHHPDHSANIDEMVRATKTTIDYCQKAFGAYPFPSLRLIEVPGYHPFGGKASAGMVLLSEDLFLQNFRDGSAINNVARNTIHEVIHQWWGEKMAPQMTRGKGVLTESITKYLEAIILARHETKEMGDRLMAYNKRRYLSGRSMAGAQEPSLLNEEDQAYLTYGKGPLVFARLQQLVGEPQLQFVLAAFLKEHTGQMSATLPDLVARLCTTFPEHQETIRKLFESTDALPLVN